MAWVTNESVLADMVRARAERQPELDVLTFEHMSLDGGATPDEVRTYAELAENANRLAAGLIARGMAKGDRFALMARNHPEFVEAMIAASISATVCVPIDPRTKGDKLAFMLANAGCSGVVCSDGALEQVAIARERSAGVGWVLVIETGEDDAVPIDSLPVTATEGVEPISTVLATPAEKIGRAHV